MILTSSSKLVFCGFQPSCVRAFVGSPSSWSTSAGRKYFGSTSTSTLPVFTSIPFSSEKLAITLFTAEFLYHALRSEQQDELLFAYISSSMQWLDAAPAGYANFHLTFLMHMSRFLGFYPNLGSLTPNPSPKREGSLRSEGNELFFDLREARFCNTAPLHRDFLQPEEAGMIQLLMRMDFPTMHLFRLSHQERNRIVDVLVQYYRLHIPQFPELRSLSVLQELWA